MSLIERQEGILNELQMLNRWLQDKPKKGVSDYVKTILEDRDKLKDVSKLARENPLIYEELQKMGRRELIEGGISPQQYQSIENVVPYYPKHKYKSKKKIKNI
jgi:hypothetical protein